MLVFEAGIPKRVTSAESTTVLKSDWALGHSGSFASAMVTG
jgi:hypothetical protein